MGVLQILEQKLTTANYRIDYLPVKFFRCSSLQKCTEVTNLYILYIKSQFSHWINTTRLSTVDT